MEASPLKQNQNCNDASNTALIEINGVDPEWVATPFRSNSISFNGFNETNITGVIAALTLH